jgi:hypothetical protein
MTPEPEVHHHTQRTGHSWVDFAVPLSALAISVISLVVAIHHGRTMQEMAEANARLVQANSWPLLQFATGNANETGQREITLEIENVGVGPAKVISLEIFLGERRIRTPRDLIQSLEPGAGRPQLSLGMALPMVVRAGDDALILGLKREGQEALWDKLNAARFELRFRACYCSVFDECWVSDLTTVSPQRVEQCAVTPDTFTFLSSPQSPEAAAGSAKL